MKTVQKKNKITVELQTDDDTVFKIYNLMNSNGSLSTFLESLVSLKINKYESKVQEIAPVNEVKSAAKSDLTFSDSVLSLLYDLKENIEELKESVVESPKIDINLDSIGDVVKSVMSTIPASTVAHSVNTSSEVGPMQDSVPQAAQSLDLSYLDEQIGQVVKTPMSSDSTSATTEDALQGKKKSMKSMNMAKMKKLKGG